MNDGDGRGVKRGVKKASRSFWMSCHLLLLSNRALAVIWSANCFYCVVLQYNFLSLNNGRSIHTRIDGLCSVDCCYKPHAPRGRSTGIYDSMLHPQAESSQSALASSRTPWTGSGCFRSADKADLVTWADAAGFLKLGSLVSNGASHETRVFQCSSRRGGWARCGVDGRESALIPRLAVTSDVRARSIR